MPRKASRIITPVDPIYRVPDKYVDDEALVERAIECLNAFEQDRRDWLLRREEYYLGWDDYLTPNRVGYNNEYSNFHLPLTETQVAAMHARIMQAAFFVDPGFFVDPQEDLDAERILKIERYMKYVLERYTNFNEGIYNAIDDWAWDLSSGGIGILSRDWVVEHRRFIDIEKNSEFYKLKINFEKTLTDDMDEDEFMKLANELKLKPYTEVARIRPYFNGPIVRAEDPEYVLFKGDVVDCTDLNQHETVLKICYFTRDELIAFKESEFMDEDAVNEVISRDPDVKGNTDFTIRQSRLNFYKDQASGIHTTNPIYKEDKYEFICAYDRVNTNGLDGNNVRDKLVYYVHTGTKKLMRWTFLDRITKTGKIPLHMCHLYRRPRKSIGRGIVETQHSLNDMADVLINQTITAGMLANNPMFAFKKDTTFDPGEFRMGPGMGIGTDDPNSDFRFFTFNVNTQWATPILNLIQTYAAQQTSIGPQSFGQVAGAVGPLRSTSGVREMANAADIQLDVQMKRVGRCLSNLYEGLYIDCVDRMPGKLTLTILGEYGVPVIGEDGAPMQIEVSPEELRARVHFGLYANSANMNRAAQKEDAMKATGLLLQPIGLQTGVVTPQNVYELYDHALKQMRIPRYNRFITRPKGAMDFLPLDIEVRMIMQGLMPPISVNDPEHAKKIEVFQSLLESEQAQMEAQYGMVNPNAMKLLAAAIEKHGEMLEVQQKPQALGNPTGSNTSTAPGKEPAPQGAIEQEPAGTEAPEGQGGEVGPQAFQS